MKRGWCDPHYRRWLRYGDPTVIKRVVGDDRARLLFHADKTTLPPCWLWAGSAMSDGYVRMFLKYPEPSRSHLIHRVAYEWFVGPIPEGLTVDHLCHNNSDCAGGVTCLHRRCFNPDHLEAVTQKVNNDRSPKGQTAKTHCPAGHPYDEANTYPLPAGGRDCRQCINRRAREYKARQLAVNPKWRRGMRPVASKSGPL